MTGSLVRHIPLPEVMKQMSHAILFSMQVASGSCTFATIPRDYWEMPSWINRTRVEEGMKQMEEEGVIYGGSLSYRSMCRFNSGFFFRCVDTCAQLVWCQRIARVSWHSTSSEEFYLGQTSTGCPSLQNLITTGVWNLVWILHSLYTIHCG